MSEDIRNYVQKHPRFTEQIQIKAFAGLGTMYIEDKSGKVIDRLIGSVRRGSLVRVLHPFLLAPIRGRTKTRRAKFVDRVERIKEAGGKIASVHKNLTGARFAMAAYEQIGTSGRGAVGRSKSGRPQKSYTPEQLIIMEREWHSKKHATRDGALKAIRSYGIEVKREWLYVHFPIKE